MSVALCSWLTPQSNQLKMLENKDTGVTRDAGSLTPALARAGSARRARAGVETSLVTVFHRFVSCSHGIGRGPGSGAAPQIADAQGGSGGVGIMNELPCVDAVPPAMHMPVKVSMSG